MDLDTKQAVELLFGEMTFTQSRLGVESWRILLIAPLIERLERAMNLIMGQAVPLERELKFDGILRRYEDVNCPLNSLDDMADELNMAGIDDLAATNMLKYYKGAGLFPTVTGKLEAGGLNLSIGPEDL